jgi:hypothetical protein
MLKRLFPRCWEIVSLLPLLKVLATNPKEKR